MLRPREDKGGAHALDRKCGLASSVSPRAAATEDVLLFSVVHEYSTVLCAGFRLLPPASLFQPSRSVAPSIDAHTWALPRSGCGGGCAPLLMSGIKFVDHRVATSIEIRIPAERCLKGG